VDRTFPSHLGLLISTRTPQQTYIHAPWSSKSTKNSLSLLGFIQCKKKKRTQPPNQPDSTQRHFVSSFGVVISLLVITVLFSIVVDCAAATT
jgi:hypothetical protein